MPPASKPAYLEGWVLGGLSLGFCLRLPDRRVAVGGGFGSAEEFATAAAEQVTSPDPNPDHLIHTKFSRLTEFYLDDVDNELFNLIRFMLDSLVNQPCLDSVVKEPASVHSSSSVAKRLLPRGVFLALKGRSTAERAWPLLFV